MTPKDMALLAAKALDSKKAKEIKVIEIGDLTTLADYFVIAAGTDDWGERRGNKRRKSTLVQFK